MIGTLIEDRYRIESELGRGGMGVVYRAEDTLLERPVAVKVVSSTGLGTKGRSRVLQEARAAARLNHPNIVAVHDVGVTQLPDQDEPTSYIVMEFVEGQTLRDFEPRDLEQVIQLAIDICEALEAAHQQDIIHRDLKPENVSLTTTGSVKLMDFGLARISGKPRLTQQGTFLGTLSYLAPEIILGQEASPRSDLYAMGVMLFEMCAGRPPFEADNLTAVISQHLYAPVVPPSTYNDQIPPLLDKLVVEILSKKPENRPASARAVRGTLKDISLAVVSPQTPTATTQLNRLVRGRMVGRDSEFAETLALWEKSAAGSGQLLMISGDPGIGKTRLVKELITYVELAGGKTLLGLCYAEERKPFGPIAQMVQYSLENGHNLELPHPVLADLLTLSPELRLTYPDIPPNERLEPEAEQQRLFDSIVTWFGALTKDDRLLLVVDDVHWADSGSLALLRYLARRLLQRPALIVATYREVELDASLPFQEMLADVNRERLATRIKLTSLDKGQTQELLTTLFSEETTPDFLDGVFRETEGNPFFIEEVCKALVDSGKLFYEGGRWQRPDDIEDLEIPQGIRLAIQSRLSKLSTEEQHTLQVAALLGREFEYEMLVGVSDQEEELLIRALEKAEEAQLIEEVQRTIPGASPNFAFTHALIHSTLLSNLSTLRRQRLQREVALALEECYPDRQEELAPLLGRYFSEAGDGDRGIKYLLTAGDSARAVFAYDEAIEAYEHALLFLKELGDHEHAARILMKLGLTYHNIFAFESSRKAYDQGFTQWQLAAERGAIESQPLAPAPHPYRAAITATPATLDPSRSFDSFSIWCMNQLFSGLLQITAEEELVPDVAHSWEILDAGRKYVFHLREDVRWSDGEQVTAADFEYAWKRALRPELDMGLAKILLDIKGAREFYQGQLDDSNALGVKAIDEYTLVVDLEGPSSYFLQIMALSISKAVPAHVVSRHGPDWTESENIVTNGPFKLSSWIPEQGMVFERYEAYHGRFGGNLSRVEFTVEPGEAALEMYERDELDIIGPYGHLSIADAKRAVQLHPDEYISEPGALTFFLGFDTTRPPFDDVKVRQALVLAMDREALANQVAMGTTFPATGGMTPPGVVGHAPGIALPHDPDLARMRLAEAGYPGGAGLPVVEGATLEFGGPRLMIEHLADQWGRILGLHFSIGYREIGVFFDYIDRVRPDFWLGGWAADYPDPDSFLRYSRWLPGSGWRNERYESLVQDARHMADHGQRMALYRQAEQILVDEAPVAPINYGRGHVLIKPWLPGLPSSIITGNILKDIVIEPH
jgi:ABC-type oligopeptide transport system substrate-binding subunit/serine/threonine protein kinase